MAAIVLESWLGSEYEDAPDSYEFPSSYLKHFDALRRGEPVFALIYEPRGDKGRGRMAYVGLAEVVTPPVQTGRRNRARQELWRVEYRRPAEPFETPVPREVLGEPVETWLRALPRGRSRNVATFGRAVRPLTDEDFERILRLAAVNPLLEESAYPVLEEVPLVAARERTERIVNVFERRAAFRREVLAAYEFKCAVTGLGLGNVAVTKSQGVLDAAHIRPVEAMGVDSVSNGLALTPTLHRLFDQGLFSLDFVDGHLEVLTSPRLTEEMVEVKGRGVSLALRTGIRLLLPSSPSLRPNKQQVLFHQKHVFIST